MSQITIHFIVIVTVSNIFRHYDTLLFYRIDRLVKRVLLADNSESENIILAYYENQLSLSRGLMAEYLRFIDPIYLERWVYVPWFEKQKIEARLLAISAMVQHCKLWKRPSVSSIQRPGTSPYRVRLETQHKKFSRMMSHMIKSTYRYKYGALYVTKYKFRCLILNNEIRPDKKNHILNVLKDHVKWFPTHIPGQPCSIQTTTSSFISSKVPINTS